MTAEQLKTVMHNLWDCVEQLKLEYPGRPFTIDGLLLGTLGEVYAAKHFNLKLNDNPIERGYDATDKEGRKYQIKTTQAARFNFKIPAKEMTLIFIKIDKEKLTTLTIYKVDGKHIWDAKNATRKYVGVSLLENLHQEKKIEKHVL